MSWHIVCTHSSSTAFASYGSGTAFAILGPGARFAYTDPSIRFAYASIQSSKLCCCAVARLHTRTRSCCAVRDTTSCKCAAVLVCCAVSVRTIM